MRCKKHPIDLSATVGVCASCLRERLLALIAAQVQAQSQQPHLPCAPLDDRRKPDHHPPLVFPRSVSPYVSRRKSEDDDASWAAHHHLFYSTPQVGPAYSATSTAIDFETARSFKKKNKRFSILSKLFLSRSEKLNRDPRGSFPDSRESASASSPSSWLNTIFPVRGRKPPARARVFYTEESGTDHRRSCRRVNRGMSPEGEVDSEDDYDCTPDRSSALRRTPATSQRGKAAGQGYSRQVSGFAFCLSPLVRASPNPHWNQKGTLPPDLAFSGEIRGPTTKPHLATAASFCANRSRKLADFGRINHNR